MHTMFKGNEKGARKLLAYLMGFDQEILAYMAFKNDGYPQSTKTPWTVKNLKETLSVFYEMYARFMKIGIFLIALVGKIDQTPVFFGMILDSQGAHNHFLDRNAHPSKNFSYPQKKNESKFELQKKKMTQNLNQKK